MTLTLINALLLSYLTQPVRKHGFCVSIAEKD